MPFQTVFIPFQTVHVPFRAISKTFHASMQFSNRFRSSSFFFIFFFRLKVTDGMIMAASEALATSNSAEGLAEGRIYPGLSDVRSISIR